jgi:hypothetical protein
MTTIGNIRLGRLGALGVAILLGILSVLPLAGSANAARPTAPATTCHDTPSNQPSQKIKNCDRVDPIAGGCSGDAYSVPGFVRSNSWGTVELRWSPSCQTNWTRFTAGYSSVWDISVERQATSSQTHLRVGDVVNVNGGSWWYTNMVYAPGPAQACTNDVNSDNGTCTGYTN